MGSRIKPEEPRLLFLVIFVSRLPTFGPDLMDFLAFLMTFEHSGNDSLCTVIGSSFSSQSPSTPAQKAHWTLSPLLVKMNPAWASFSGDITGLGHQFMKVINRLDSPLYRAKKSSLMSSLLNLASGCFSCT